MRSAQALEAGGAAGGQQQPEDGQAPERADDVEDVADAAEGDGLGELVGRQGVGLRAGGLRRGAAEAAWRLRGMARLGEHGARS